MKLGSLFSGIGGLELGLEWALGCETVWQVEREEWPRSVLATHWPHASRAAVDVTKAHTRFQSVQGEHFIAGELSPVDLICGGFPCQDISPAGKGAGITGKKSGLWRHYARLVRELRPRFVIVENSHLLPVRGLGVVLGDLSALGYDAEWARIGVSDVGGPHRRWRCFVVAWRANADSDGRARQGEQPAGSGLADRVRSSGYGVADPDGRRCEREWVKVVGVEQCSLRYELDGCGAHVADTDSQRLQGLKRPGAPQSEPLRRAPQRAEGHNPLPTSSLRGVADGLPGWVGNEPAQRAIAGGDLPKDGRAALRALGNAVSPPVAYQVGLWLRAIIEREGL